MPTPLLTIAGAGINLGERWLLRGAELTLHAGDRLALVGRNGAGKSSLMKLMASQMDMDEGSLWIAPGAEVSYLPQSPPVPPGMTLRSVVVDGHDTDPDGKPVPLHRAEQALMRLGLDPNRMSDGLSGGEARRVSLARALYTEPDILLLDEPTNHMDVSTIEWMEGELQKHRGALLVVSHDRAFLRQLGTGIVWLHEGRLRRRDGAFTRFEEWSEAILTEQAVALHKMDRKIAAETKWSREGITARRKRNQGRLRELETLRIERARTGGVTQRSVRMETGPASAGGQLVLEAVNIGAEVDTPAPRRLFAHFNLLVRRSDRIGIVGANGAGKSTLVRILLCMAQPQGGRVRHGIGLEPAYFDQQRSDLDRESSPWTVLTQGGGDMIEVAGSSRHVTSYLRDFLFDDHKMTQKVSTLSGGEQNRLLLAKLFAGTHNFLVLDEPTNDLDMETLDLLQEVIAEYDGTILVVSHDRDFLDRTVNAVLAFEGDGRIVAHSGGYTDYLAKRQAIRQRREGGDGDGPQAKGRRAGKRKADAQAGERPERRNKLSFNDQHALDRLPAEIEALEAEIAKIETVLGDGTLYVRDPEGFNAAASRLDEARDSKQEKEARWYEAASRAESLEKGE